MLWQVTSDKKIKQMLVRLLAQLASFTANYIMIFRCPCRKHAAGSTPGSKTPVVCKADEELRHDQDAQCTPEKKIGLVVLRAGLNMRLLNRVKKELIGTAADSDSDWDTESEGEGQ